jgi:hypothetical protein
MDIPTPGMFENPAPNFIIYGLLSEIEPNMMLSAIF